MTLADIITSVQNLLQDTSFSSDSITEAANWLQDEIFANNLYQKMETSSPPIAVLAGATTAPFPIDMQEMISFYQTVPQVFDMHDFYLPYETFIARYPNFATLPASPVQYWTEFGNTIRFSAPLKTNCTFMMDYIRRPVDMVDSTDVCEIIDQYKQVISKGTLAKVMEQNEDYAEAATERGNIQPLVTAMIKNEGRGQFKTGPVIMRANRRNPKSLDPRGGGW